MRVLCGFISLFLTVMSTGSGIVAQFCTIPADRGSCVMDPVLGYDISWLSLAIASPESTKNLKYNGW